MGELGCMVVQKWGLLMSLFLKLEVWIVRLEPRCYDMHAIFYQSLVLCGHFFFRVCCFISFSFNSHYCYSDCDHDSFLFITKVFFFGVSLSISLLSMFFLQCFFHFKSLCDHGCKRHISYSFQTWSLFVMLSDITLFTCRFDSSPCGFAESISEWLVSTILVYLATFARPPQIDRRYK